MRLHRTYCFDVNGNLPEELSSKIKEIGLKYAGKQFEITLTNEHKRSNLQNRYLHGILIPMITEYIRKSKKEAGDQDYYKISEDKIKLWIKEEFLGYEEVNGERRLRHTSKLSTVEMMELKDQLQIYWIHRGLLLPDPNQEDFLEDELGIKE